MHSAKAITDENRSLKIGYTEGNNMPAMIIHEGGTIMNRYSFGGQKLGRSFTDVKGQLISDETYYGSLVMEQRDPRRILFEDGYIDLTPGQRPVFNYHLKDHLGNVRIVLQPGGLYGRLVQSNDYFPFGMAYTKERMRFKIPAFISVSDDNSYTAETPTYSKDNPYLYNGKEEQPMPGKWLDYGFRFYDPQLAMWHSVDPASELMSSWSPYNYCFGNPIRFEDKDGAIPLETIWDVANVVMGVTSMVNNIKQGNYSAALADAGGALVDVAAVVVPYVPGGASTAIKAARAADNAVDAVKAAKTVDKVTDTKKAATMVENAKNGKAFEKKVGGTLDGAKAEQVTIEATDGTKTKVDFAQNKDGKVSLTEAKGSDTAPLTKNQKSSHPQIEQSGGTVRGNKGQDIGLPAGTKIPPTKVEIVRPNDLK